MAARLTSVGSPPAPPEIEISQGDGNVQESNNEPEQSTDQALESIIGELESGKAADELLGDDGAAERPAAEVETKESIPPEKKAPADEADDDDSDDAAATEGDEVAAEDGELSLGLRTLEELYGLPANDLEGFSSVKDAERHIAVLYQKMLAPPAQEEAPADKGTPPKAEQKPAEQGDSLKLELDKSLWSDDEAEHQNLTKLEEFGNKLVERVNQALGAVGHIYQQQIQAEAVQEVNKYNLAMDKLASPVFGDSSKGLTDTQVLLRKKHAIVTASLGQTIIQRGGKALDYDALIPIANATPEFAALVAKGQQQQNTNGKSGGKHPRRLGRPGRGLTKDSFGKASVYKFDGDPEDNPAFMDEVAKITGSKDDID